MRIAHVCRVGWPHLGGMERVVDGLSRAQARLGHQVEVWTLDRAPDGSPLDDGELDGVRYRRLPRLGPRRYPMARGLLGAVRGADLVHAHGLDGLVDQLVLGRWRHGAPVGVSTHGGFLHTDRQRWLKRLWLHGVSRHTAGRAHRVWFSSDADARALKPLRGVVVPNGVDLAPFRAIERRPEPGRWLVFGRVDVHKGHADLLHTLAALARRGSEPFTLHVVGPEARDGLVDALARRAAHLGLGDRVIFKGASSQAGLAQELSRCTLAFFPSHHEGFGIAVVEAMAAGVPVVVSPIEAHRALVRDGRTGLVAPFTEPETAASRLRAFRRAALLELGRAARHAAEAHGWPRRVYDWERAYRDLLQEAR